MSEHIPVLAQKLSETVNLPANGVIVDATVGYAGHSILFGRKLSEKGTLIGLDVDPQCLKTAGEKLNHLKCAVKLVRSNFAGIAKTVENAGFSGVDFILADLGWCSGQITDPKRGLSFQENMPLDMRLDDRGKITAADIVNQTEEKELADIIYKYGDERVSRRIARFIVEYRLGRTINTTGQLASIICRATGKRPGFQAIHPATKTFQAIRIAVNSELENLEKLLKAASGVLNENGYIAVISFHSLEDRIVKNDFKDNKSDGIYKIITKKPIVPDRDEIKENPRSRSAKLRIAQKITN